ncbi:hypothetical protein [Brevundimonas lutea]|nr:hypothetical protein [Brevundimonas lutea]
MSDSTFLSAGALFGTDHLGGDLALAWINALMAGQLDAEIAG